MIAIQHRDQTSRPPDSKPLVYNLAYLETQLPKSHYVRPTEVWVCSGVALLAGVQRLRRRRRKTWPGWLHTQCQRHGERHYPAHAMNDSRPKRAFFGPVVLLGCLASPLAPEANGQPQDQSPSGLVKFLMRPTDVGTTVSCAIDYDTRINRAVAKALVSQGQAALPAVEQALDLLKKPGARYSVPPGLYLLLYAYAKIQGQSAFPRLWDLNTDPELWPLEMDSSQAIALALGLTSYVPENLSLARILRCLGPQPRDALNQLILAWGGPIADGLKTLSGGTRLRHCNRCARRGAGQTCVLHFGPPNPRATWQLATDSSFRGGFPCRRWTSWTRPIATPTYLGLTYPSRSRRNFCLLPDSRTGPVKTVGPSRSSFSDTQVPRATWGS